MRDSEYAPLVVSLEDISSRVRNLESQAQCTPVRYTVIGSGYMVAPSIVGATSISISTVPVYVDTQEFWIVIDVGTEDAELRKITGIADYCIVSFSDGLDYAHAEDDSILFVDSAIINVLWWGAKGDGTTNDLLAVTRAYTQASLLATVGSTIYFPKGTYYIYDVAAGLLQLYANTTVCGDGWGSILYVRDITGILYSFGGSKITIRNIQLKAHASSTYTRGITFDTNCTGVLIDSVLVDGCWYMISLVTGCSATIRNSVGVNLKALANTAAIYSVSTDLNVVNCVVQSSLHKYLVYYNSSGGNIRDCAFIGHTSYTFYNIYILGSSYVTVSSCYIVKSGGVDSSTIMIEDGSTNILIIGNRIVTDATTGGYTGITALQSSAIRIVGNSTINHSQRSIYLNGCEYVTLEGNSLAEVAPKHVLTSNLNTFLHDRLWWYCHVEDFTPTVSSGGYPVLTRIGAANEDPNTWAFQDAATTAVSTWVPITPRLRRSEVEIYIMFSQQFDNYGTRYDIRCDFVDLYDLTFVYSASIPNTNIVGGQSADTLYTVRIFYGQLWQYLNKMSMARIRIRRNGASGDDTAVGDFYLHGVMFIANR